MQCDYLADSKGLFALLINCQITQNSVYCGIAIFRGGISGQLKVMNGNKEVMIQIPEFVRLSATPITLHEKNDDCIISIPQSQ